MHPAFLALSFAFALHPGGVSAQSPTPRPDARAQVTQAAATSPRPSLRPALTAPVAAQAALGASGFDAWLGGFASRARAQGVQVSVLNAALAGIAYDPSIIRLDRNQAEFTKQLWDYLDSAVSNDRINSGRRGLRTHLDALTRIERRYGVEKEVIVAVWGLESAYGGFRGNTDTVQALATLAYDGRRGAFFEAELIAALKIVQAGEIGPRAMRGSWAGAMGHTQFMPSSYLDHAVDFTGDGRRNIWSDNPVDALASTGAYLDSFGWKKGQPWGVEVRLPQGFDFALAGDGPKSTSAWGRLGVRDTAGQNVPNHGRASLLVPAGATGPAFLTFDNFDVIKAYNSSTSYAMAVGHLAARIAGGPDFATPWPRGDRALSALEKREIQERLTASGFSTNGIDGKVGPDTIAAIRRYQQAAGLVPDGYANTRLLARLR
jgi:membrane-bound lytic murein transglycosylase B